MPERVRLSRTKGWRIPPDTVNVTRGPGRQWGNPYIVGLVACGHRAAGECDCNTFRRATAAEAVQAFREIPRSSERLAHIRAELSGRNLACWCPPDQPCHADVLLQLANS